MKIKITTFPKNKGWIAQYDPWFGTHDCAWGDTEDEARARLIARLRDRYAPRKTEEIEI